LFFVLTIGRFANAFRRCLGRWYFNLKVNNQDNSIIMSQIRYIDYRRMDKIISTITADDLKIVRESLIELIRGL
jgi:hypothetical protein